MKVHKFVVGAVLAGISLSGLSLARDGFVPAVSSEGEISVPDVDYRRDWSHLGTWSVAGDEDAVSFHSVYTQPETVDAFRKTGAFPDGAILIKELWGGKTEDLTTGTASHASEPAGWFVMVRDTKGRFEGNPLWGDGWGWAFFDPGKPEKTTSTDYRADCLACHEPVRASELVYTYAYPALKKRGDK